MFTIDEAKSFRLSYDAEVKFLSRMSKQGLRTVEARHMNELGIVRAFGGPESKDEFITSILNMAGFTIDRLNESIHVLYHDASTPNEACKSCMLAPDAAPGSEPF